STIQRRSAKAAAKSSFNWHAALAAQYLPKALHIAALRSDLIKADSQPPTPLPPKQKRPGSSPGRF
ncbi:hypothetical protein, partial [Devosia sediminis]|uniref:hypothetical protein n=1 Tax=Devosia sediminis TaxID=2798801 RepID=UPI001AEF1133